MKSDQLFSTSFLKIQAKQSILVVIGLLLLPLTQAHGQVINVQFSDGQGGTNPSEILNGDAWSPSISPLAYTGTTWSEGFAGNGTNLPFSDGTASTVNYALSGSLNITNNGVSPLALLTEAYYASSGDMTLTITGLQNNQAYDLYLASAFDGNGSNMTIGAQTLSTTGVASGSSFVNGVNYVEFTGIDPVSNSIVVTVAPNGTGFNLGLLEGFQLTPVETPEPSSLALVGLGAAALLVFAYRSRRILL